MTIMGKSSLESGGAAGFNKADERPKKIEKRSVDRFGCLTYFVGHDENANHPGVYAGLFQTPWRDGHGKKSGR
jgi:hypothetical protein